VGEGDADAEVSVMNMSKQMPVSVWHLPEDPTKHLRQRGAPELDGLIEGDAVTLMVDVTLIVGLGELDRLGLGAFGVSTKHSKEPRGHIAVPSAYPPHRPSA
jgi:hypothetical protein